MSKLQCPKCEGLGKYDYYDESDNWICIGCNGTGKYTALPNSVISTIFALKHIII